MPIAIKGLGAGASNEWYTPPYVFDAMGATFDLDVAHPGLDVVDWVPAMRVYTERGLQRPWAGFLWMNAPFGGPNGLVPWLERWNRHGDGVALTPDRTSSAWWQWYAPQADAVLFVSPRIQFVAGIGTKESKSNAGGTTLLAQGERGVRALANAERNGLGVRLK